MPYCAAHPLPWMGFALCEEARTLFFKCREQKSHDDGGRRRQQWWLVDDNGHEHLAVVGEERDPRDGHYNYYAEKPFSLIRPLACQNRTKVHEYLEAVSYSLISVTWGCLMLHRAEMCTMCTDMAHPEGVPQSHRRGVR